ncbi:MAG: asparagine synthase (glutamine-hydrolyzing) [Armatimonadetes bacterium]|nr:asparagine synthase (glutamine-hydrolyzing) [Armatimonadota bacterium]
MCGITGFWNGKGIALGEAHEILGDMCHRMALRGPDDEGLWVEPSAGVGLGFRRLAIVDLTPMGHQPMRSESERFTITFNGEIYNAPEIREELLKTGHTFRGHSDTEVMLAAMEEWGVRRATERFNGMFAYAVWDAKERRLSLGRDHVGIKPLYYGWAGDSFVYSSEIKPLHAYPEFRKYGTELDSESVQDFLLYGYIPAPNTIFKSLRKLPPGHILELNAAAERSNPTPFWSLRDVVNAGRRNMFRGSEQEAVSALESLLKSSVKMQMLSDVPLGAFLSGGIDSSTVVALMQAQSSKPVKTFTIGFKEAKYNEADAAAIVAKHLGTDHTELIVTPQESQSVIKLLPDMYDEPFADASQIPTFLVSRLARQSVTVTLSGDGGDELFGGYQRYLFSQKLWGYIGKLPFGVRRSIHNWIMKQDVATLDKRFQSFSSLGKLSGKEGPIGHKLKKLAPFLIVKAPEDFAYADAKVQRADDLLQGFHEPVRGIEIGDVDVANFIERMMIYDTLSYLHDDILTKVDRASMGVSLESRVPLLDHRIVEFAWTLPFHHKVRDGKGKWILRQIFQKHLPAELLERPKSGFAIPIGDWLRTDLRDWAEDLLNSDHLASEGLFDVALVRRRWDEHLTGTYNWDSALWKVLMLQAWRARWCS